jgi:predicted nucleic acid-binding protein
MSRLCLDTSAYSNFKRGHAPAVDLIRGCEWLGVPVIVLGELRYGFRAGDRNEKNETELRAFLKHAVVQILDLDEEVSQHYADIVTALRLSGTPVPTNDAWIAATAVRHGATILTYDPHFRRISTVGVRLLNRA